MQACLGIADQSAYRIADRDSLGEERGIADKLQGENFRTSGTCCVSVQLQPFIEVACITCHDARLPLHRVLLLHAQYILLRSSI